ncbi:MAG: hypothetical protein Q8Q38_00870 [bacterium]|nr:hypothetical protein [bacterium]MDZ4232108.1 hypothetical protein [Candidatus Pacearchaeota archaeon]
MKIFKDDKLIAIVFEKFESDGTVPQTEGEYPLQLLMMRHPKGKVFDAHTHEPRDRATTFLQEAIVVVKGKLKADILTRNGEFVSQITLSPGQCVFLVDGAYKIEVLEDVEFYEFKNGPFLEDKVLL